MDEEDYDGLFTTDTALRKRKKRGKEWLVYDIGRTYAPNSFLSGSKAMQRLVTDLFGGNEPPAGSLLLLHNPVQDMGGLLLLVRNTAKQPEELSLGDGARHKLVGIGHPRRPGYQHVN